MTALLLGMFDREAIDRLTCQVESGSQANRIWILTSYLNMTINDYRWKAPELSNARPNDCYSKTVRWITCKIELFQNRRTQSVLSLELIDCTQRRCRLRSVIKKERSTTIKQNADLNVHFRELNHKEGMRVFILWRYTPDMPTSHCRHCRHMTSFETRPNLQLGRSSGAQPRDFLFVPGHPRGPRGRVWSTVNNNSSNNSRGDYLYFHTKRGRAKAIIRGRRLFRIFLTEVINMYGLLTNCKV